MEEILNLIEEKGRLLILSLSGLVLVLLFAVAWLFFQNEPKEMAPETDIYEELLAEETNEVEEPDIEESAVNDIEPASTTTSTEVVVDVKGAVHEPGVYTMGESSRIVDAIAKAGGLLDSAEQNAINLAQIVEDQMVIYVPQIGEEGTHVELFTQTEQTMNTEEDSEGKININEAEKEALMTLNGIGSSKADNILTYREENGLFQSIEEIKNVSGIGEATFSNLKEHIVVNP